MISLSSDIYCVWLGPPFDVELDMHFHQGQTSVQSMIVWFIAVWDLRSLVVDLDSKSLRHVSRANIL